MMLPPCEAEHLHLTGVWFEEAFEYLDRRRLAGAVRPEQSEALTTRDDERQTVDGHDVAVAFDQIDTPYANHCVIL
jgi:hypothetical protein